jgi:hypothetical protein
MGQLPDGVLPVPVREATVIRPGEHLLVRVDMNHQLTREMMFKMCDLIGEQLAPWNITVSVIPADGFYIIRPDEKPPFRAEI